jgi:sn-glycerol 3-phosphate transport system permease protein
MVDRNPVLDTITHVILILAVLTVGFPIYYAVVASTLTLEEVSRAPMPLIPGDQFMVNMQAALAKGNILRVLLNTFIMAAGVTVGKIAISILSAFSVVYFNYRGRMFAFWLVFVTLMLPVEVRILPTYEVATNLLAPLQWLLDALQITKLGAVFGYKIQIGLQLSIVDTYAGLIMPLVASATATFVFRQFFLTVPDELCEQAKIDGAGPMRFFWSILAPMSRTNMAALVVILFVYGWNQYLWPLLVTTDANMRTAMIGVRYLMPGPNDPQIWNVVMAAALMVLAPPAIVVMVMQRWFVKGLIEGEK